MKYYFFQYFLIPDFLFCNNVHPTIYCLISLAPPFTGFLYLLTVTNKYKYKCSGGDDVGIYVKDWWGGNRVRHQRMTRVSADC